ncbi:membrane-associated progesterone receptor [Niveomyces insectorum RCEF 264]|uniref:Membrane-associated progesterone receptor n=1 Tax=Niveomyces insectorum RCEF 264 TaxID=1081102 RepID=A0A167QER0_9HYPO|nr:membrane-associated progesterone receptor [Niveomyces insectorum RCEF 264]
MSESEPTARQRKLQKQEPEPSASDADAVHARKPARKTRTPVDDEDDYSPWLDIVRVLTFLLIASAGLSYLVTSGESWVWGMKEKPNYLKLSWWKTQYIYGGDEPFNPRYMTLDELAQYDGTDADKPIYLSINGSIYDVTAGRRIYGPGGSYHWFAGVDASRGFVTGCFAEDRTGDMRGVEDMYLPLDDPDIDRQWSPEELARKKEEERAEAHQRMHDALKHWVEFFRKSEKYPYVGQLVREPGWEGERKPLCKIAQDGRVPRKAPGEE